jgi:hypothetical protein
MNIRLGNTVTFVEGFYNDPYSFVPVFENFDKLEAMGISSGSPKFSIAIRDASAIVDKIISKSDSDEDVLFLTTILFGEEYNIIVGINDVVLSYASMIANEKADALRKLERQVSAGQLRLFEDTYS